MLLQLKKRERKQLESDKDVFNQFQPYIRLLRKTAIYELYEIPLIDMRLVLFKTKFFNPLLIRDDDNDVLRRLYVFEEEMKLKPFLFNDIPRNVFPMMEYSDDKVVVWIGERNVKPDIVKIISPAWDFLFKYTISFPNVVLKMKKHVSLILEIPTKDYINALYTILIK